MVPLLRRHTARLLVLLVASALALGCALIPGQGGSQNREVRFGASATWPIWPFHMATNRDSFSKAGLQVTFLQMTTPPQVIEAMVAGSLDAGAAAVSSYATAIEKGAKIKAVGLLTGLGHPPNTFFVRKAADIGPGPTSGRAHGSQQLRRQLRPLPAVPAGQRRPRPQRRADRQATGQRHDAGAHERAGRPGIVSSSLAKQIENTQGEHVEVFARQTEVDAFRERINGLMLIMNESFIRDNRATARAFIGVLADNADWVNENPREALTAFSEEIVQRHPAVLTQDEPNDFPEGLRLDMPSMQGELDIANRSATSRRGTRPRTSSTSACSTSTCRASGSGAPHRRPG